MWCRETVFLFLSRRRTTSLRILFSARSAANRNQRRYARGGKDLKDEGSSIDLRRARERRL